MSACTITDLKLPSRGEVIHHKIIEKFRLEGASGDPTLAQIREKFTVRAGCPVPFASVISFRGREWYTGLCNVTIEQ